ncbi:hypothetical protein ACFQZC_34050 [Streptacidiphilus monticola]
MIGSEHFAERLQLFACAGSPVLDPVTGELRGIVDLTTWHHEAHPLMAALAREAALAVQLRLLDQYSQRERAWAASRRRELTRMERTAEELALQAARISARSRRGVPRPGRCPRPATSR